METGSATVAVVGAGASGTLATIQLLEHATVNGLRIVLFSGSGTLGRGVAYATPDPSHLLNVPACAMSAFADQPDDFVRWLDEHGHPGRGHDLVARSLYGDYLEDRLTQAIERAGSRGDVQVITDEVIDIERRPNGPTVCTAGGLEIEVHAVVLATGTQPPRDPSGSRGGQGNHRCIVNPWLPNALDVIGSHDAVTLVGTGLTSVDIVLSLARRGHVGPIYAFSRHGLLPQAHRLGATVAGPIGCQMAEVPGTSARALLHHIRELITREVEAGVDWRVPFDRLRPLIPTLWERMPDVERRRFCRHAERFWDIHRHRMAPTTADQLDRMCQDGRLHVAAGHLIAVRDEGSGVSLTVSTKHAGHRRVGEHDTEWLINCTGPTHLVDGQGDSLVARLVARGTLRPGPLGLGIDATASGHAIDGDGNQVGWIWAVGPLLRGRLYETTAIPEIRVQAHSLAADIHGWIGAGHHRQAPNAVDAELVMPTWAMPRVEVRLEIVTCESSDVGDRSYLVHDGTTGVVIDPQCDIERVEGEAARRGVAIAYVLETHIHNDYVSGGLNLARRQGATYALSGDEPVAFGAERRALHGGDTLHVGGLDIEVVRTPGHTPHHLSYVVRHGVDDAALFSGGSMLRDATGRTDLFDLEAAELLARAQWRSVRHLAASLGPETILCPTHGFGSFCAAAPASNTPGGATVGEQFLRNPALVHDEQTFVSDLLRHRRPSPRYYGHMAPLNRRGTCAIFPAALRRRTIGPSEAADGTVVVDLRPRRDFALSHLAGSLNIEWVDSFAAYVGWTVPWGTPVTLLAEEWRQLERAAEALARIGIDEVSGALHNPSGMVAAYRVADFSDLVTATQRGESPLVVDARDRAEWEVGHLPMAELIPFYCVEAGVSLLPSDVDVWVHCARGYRAAIAASILERHGRRPILIDDSYEHAVALGLAGQIHQVGA